MAEVIGGFHEGDVENGNSPELINIFRDYISNRDPDQFIEKTKDIKEIETRLCDYEQIRQEVKAPGTMTHVIELRKPKAAEFWLKLKTGEDLEIQYDYDETSTSFNTTNLEGLNISVDSPMENEIWTLKNPSGFLNNGLIIFSKTASEKMAGRKYIDDEMFLRLQEAFPNGHEFFNHLKSKGIESPDRFGDGPGGMPQQQADIALYERLCYMLSEYKISKEEIDKRFLSRINRMNKYIDKYGGSFGYRFQGIHEKNDHLTWGPLPIEKEDISSLTMPVDPGKSYLHIF